MNVLKMVFLLLAAISVPLLSCFLIRLVLKLSRAVDQLNRTLKDARPQLNMLLLNLNKTAEEINLELENVTAATGEVLEMLKGLESSFAALDKALRSPWAKWGGSLAAAAAGSSLLRRILYGR